MIVVNFDVKIIRRNPRDSIACVYATRSFDDHHHVLVRAMPNDAKKARELRLDETSVERELAASKSLCRGKSRFGFPGDGTWRGRWGRCSIGQSQASRML